MAWSRRLPRIAFAVLAAAVPIGVVPIGGAAAVASSPSPAAPRSAAPSPAAPAPSRPVLAIAVDDGTRQVEAGQSMRYEITLRDDGTAPVPLTVTVDAPPALTGLTPDSSGTVAGHTVRWQVTVPARGQAELRLAGRVAGGVPADPGQLAVIACATLPDGKAPIVCGTDLDQLARPAAAPAGPAWWRWPLIGLASLLVLSAPAARLLRR